PFVHLFLCVVGGLPAGQNHVRLSWVKRGSRAAMKRSRLGLPFSVRLLSTLSNGRRPYQGPAKKNKSSRTRCLLDIRVPQLAARNLFLRHDNLGTLSRPRENSPAHGPRGSDKPRGVIRWNASDRTQLISETCRRRPLPEPGAR